MDQVKTFTVEEFEEYARAWEDEPLSLAFRFASHLVEENARLKAVYIPTESDKSLQGSREGIYTRQDESIVVVRDLLKLADRRQDQIEQLEAQLAQIKGLPAQWRERTEPIDRGYVSTRPRNWQMISQCADELDAILNPSKV